MSMWVDDMNAPIEARAVTTPEIRPASDEVRQFVLNVFYDANGHCIGCANVVSYTGSMPYLEPHESYCRVEEAIDTVIARIEADRARIRQLEAEVEKRRNAEASVCPEDFDIVEYVTYLRAEIEKLQGGKER